MNIVARTSNPGNIHSRHPRAIMAPRRRHSIDQAYHLSDQSVDGNR